MKQYLLSNYPLTFNSLVVETTTKCTAKCGMCYQSASPKGSDLLGDNQLSAEVIKQVIRESITSLLSVSFKKNNF